MVCTLDQLRAGQRGSVVHIALSPERAASLIRLGLRVGTELLCLRRTPLGDPTVYRFCGTDVAIRRKDAAGIEVRSEN